MKHYKLPESPLNCQEKVEYYMFSVMCIQSFFRVLLIKSYQILKAYKICMRYKITYWNIRAREKVVDQKQGCVTFRVQKFRPSMWAISYSLALVVVTADSTDYYRWQVKAHQCPFYAVSAPTPLQAVLPEDYQLLSPCSLLLVHFVLRGCVFLCFLFIKILHLNWLFLMPKGVEWGSEISGSTLHTLVSSLS